ncbi:MAG: hypothetical protein RSE41_01125 [Clostridia bacterium]
MSKNITEYENKIKNSIKIGLSKVMDEDNPGEFDVITKYIYNEILENIPEIADINKNILNITNDITELYENKIEDIKDNYTDVLINYKDEINYLKLEIDQLKMELDDCKYSNSLF